MNIYRLRDHFFLTFPKSFSTNIYFTCIRGIIGSHKMKCKKAQFFLIACFHHKKIHHHLKSAADNEEVLFQIPKSWKRPSTLIGKIYRFLCERDSSTPIMIEWPVVYKYVRFGHVRMWPSFSIVARGGSIFIKILSFLILKPMGWISLWHQ